MRELTFNEVQLVSGGNSDCAASAIGHAAAGVTLGGIGGAAGYRAAAQMAIRGAVLGAPGGIVGAAVGFVAGAAVGYMAFGALERYRYGGDICEPRSS